MNPSRIALALVTSLLAFSPAAQATIITYTASLSGLNEFPSNLSPATGYATITVDDALNTMAFNVSFAGLIGTTTAAHLHCCTATPLTGTAGVATTTPNFSGFPLGVLSGTFSTTLDMTLLSSYNPSFVTAYGTIPAAEAFLFNGMAQGQSYLNIHTNAFAGGEIRGFLTEVRAPVPEPATLALFGLGLAGLGRFRRSKAG